MSLRRHARALMLLGQLAAVPLAGQVRSSSSVDLPELTATTEAMAARVVDLTQQLQQFLELRREIAASRPIHPGEKASDDELAALREAYDTWRSRLVRVAERIADVRERLSQAEGEMYELSARLGSTTARDAKQQEYVDALSAYTSELQQSASALLLELDLATGASTPAADASSAGAGAISDELQEALKGLMVTAAQPPSGVGGPGGRR